MKETQKISYHDFCKKFGREYGDALRPDQAEQVAKEHGYKITDLHNVRDDAKADGRL